MNKLIIGALVGGIILFFWQFLSWTVLNLHAGNQQYTAKQDSVLAYLSTQFDEDGFYFMPNVPPGTSPEESQAAMEKGMGKPWAQVYYHKSMNTNMTSNMIRGLLTDIIAVLLLCWVLLHYKDNSFKHSILVCLSIGIIGWLVNNYTTSIWYELPAMPDLIDSIVGFGLVGVWLGWYLNRK